MRKEVKELQEASPPKYPVAHVIRGGGRPMNVYIRGNPAKRGAAVPRRFPALLSKERPTFTQGSGRLELAQAIAAPDNALTSRVIGPT